VEVVTGAGRGVGVGAVALVAIGAVVVTGAGGAVVGGVSGTVDVVVLSGGGAVVVVDAMSGPSAVVGPSRLEPGSDAVTATWCDPPPKHPPTANIATTAATRPR
jgi:hypothetical protein